MKKYVIATLLIFLSFPGFSDTITAINSGYWTDTTNTWGGTAPASGDLIIIPNGITVTIPSFNFVDLTGTETTVIRIEDGGTLTLASFSSLILDSGDGDKIVLVSENSTLNNTWINVFGIQIPTSSIIMGTEIFTDETTTGPAVLQDGVLPIELLYFRAEPQDDAVALEWATSLEENFDYFTVERSVDGMNFKEMTKIYGAGNTDEKQYYAWTDHPPVPGLLYYRLKATDFDGTFEYFDIVSVRYFGGASREVTLYPNPACNGQVNVRFHYRPAGPVSVVIYDTMGRQYLRQTLSGESGTLNLPRNMRQGVYLVQIDDQTNKMQVRLSVR